MEEKEPLMAERLLEIANGCPTEEKKQKFIKSMAEVSKYMKEKYAGTLFEGVVNDLNNKTHDAIEKDKKITRG